MPTCSWPRSVVCLAALGALASPRRALADDDVKAACAAAYEQSQVYRAASKLKKAQEALAVCLQEACPTFIQADCGQWLADVERALPTVVVAAKNERGEDVVAVRVFIDGEALAEKLDDKEIAVDPGQHSFRFEMAGAAPVEQRVLVRKGEKYRVLDVRFTAPHPVSRAPTMSSEEPAAGNGEPRPGPLRPYAYVAGGVGVAGVTGFLILAALAKGREHHLAGTCSPTCSTSDVDSLRTEYTVANVSLGLGLVGLGSGVALFFLSQPKHPEREQSRRWDVHLATTNGGAFTSMTGRF